MQTRRTLRPSAAPTNTEVRLGDDSRAELSCWLLALPPSPATHTAISLSGARLQVVVLTAVPLVQLGREGALELGLQRRAVVLRWRRRHGAAETVHPCSE